MNSGGITGPGRFRGAHARRECCSWRRPDVGATFHPILLRRSGTISGSNNLTIAGAYTIYNPGTYTASGTDYKNATFTTSGNDVRGDGRDCFFRQQYLHGGSTTINQYGTLQLGGTNAGSGFTTAGSIDNTSGVTNNGTLVFNRSNAYHI